MRIEHIAARLKVTIEVRMGSVEHGKPPQPLSFHVDYWDNQGWHDRD